jgi:acetyl esterase/lipase
VGDRLAGARSTTTIPYGEHPDQVGDLHLPDGDGPHPVVVILHGGFWRHIYDRAYITPLAADLASRGYAAWNLEFRRMAASVAERSDSGGSGGFPMTLDDAAAGIDFVDALAAEHDLDVDRVAILGHSAGGHLALWAAGRANPVVVPAVVIAQAAVADLRHAHELGLGAGAVELFMGGPPEELPDAYAIASPAERLPTGIRQVLVHGRADENVPIEVARRYAVGALGAGDDVELLEFDTEHMSLVDPGHESWLAVLDRLP